MNIRLHRFLPLLLILTAAAFMSVSCSHEQQPSEELYFQALEQSASGLFKEAADSLAACIARRDEWASVATDQLLHLLSDHPFLEVQREAVEMAREYHPLQGSTLKTKKDYPLTYSAQSLAGFTVSLLDDIGSSWVRGEVDKLAAADLMAEAASLKDTQLPSPDSSTEKWTLCFYAGRLYEKNGSSTRKSALSWYSEACSQAFSELSYDRPLWYFLELSRKADPKSTAARLQEYASTWNDPAYFDDFFDRLASDLLSRYDWPSFFRVYTENEPFMSSASRAKYAFISARLLECGLCPSDSGNPVDEAAALYDTVLQNARHGTYYNMLAHYRTGKPFTPASTEALPSDETSYDEFTEHLLDKYAEYDYADLAYRCLKENCDSLSTPAIIAAYNYLTTKQEARNQFLSLTSLALKTASSRPADETLLQLAFPVYFRTYVEAETRSSRMKPWLLFALIHSESCFQADITSAAGAHGLTQLMDATAGDIARKLKVPEYDLNDAPTNIMFGGFYLNELIGRLDGDELLAVFSYNAGITRVRNWKRAAPTLPADLFLETVPYEETRVYGQKIIRAAVMYGMLYYNESFSEIIEHFLSPKS